MHNSATKQRPKKNEWAHHDKTRNTCYTRIEIYEEKIGRFRKDPDTPWGNQLLGLQPCKLP